MPPVLDWLALGALMHPVWKVREVQALTLAHPVLEWREPKALKQVAVSACHPALSSTYVCPPAASLDVTCH